MTIIDVWAQPATRRFLAEPCFDTLKRWTGISDAEIPLEHTRQAMQDAGVTLALLSAWYGPQGALISNDEIAASVRAHPEQFAGLAAVDLRRPVDAVRELRSRVTQDGFKGLRVVQWLWELPCTHALYYPLLACCVELDVPICLQVGLTGPLHTSDTGRPLLIERIALDFPDLKIICGHIGYPWQNEMIAIATKFPNVYIDTSAYKPSRYPPELVSYLKTNGKRKVMFGTNYPMLSPADCTSGIDALGLSHDTQELFLSGNAKRVFGL
jgi:predicted TIM-barrel fold metal-dependent hydrolase